MGVGPHPFSPMSASPGWKKFAIRCFSKQKNRNVCGSFFEHLRDVSMKQKYVLLLLAFPVSSFCLFPLLAGKFPYVFLFFAGGQPTVPFSMILELHQRDRIIIASKRNPLLIIRNGIQINHSCHCELAGSRVSRGV